MGPAGMKVSNRACIRNLSLKGLRAARTRNLIAVLAIALTTVMFTSLFTIAASINHSFQQENFRMAGGDMHASIKNITWEQAEQLRADPLVKEGGARLFLGMPEEEPFNKSHVEVSYMEPQLASNSHGWRSLPLRFSFAASCARRASCSSAAIRCSRCSSSNSSRRYSFHSFIT